MKIKIRKIHPDAILPAYAKPGDAGMDLIATSKKLVDEKVFGYVEYGTGLTMEIPEGHVGLIYPRSSVSKTGLIMANSVGVIDSGYRGEVSVRFKHVPSTLDYKIGDKVAQLIILPHPIIEFEESEKLSETERGDGGFGSTDKV